MQVHAVMECSLVNGPGRRTVVWFQGCKLSCPGCWNEATHSQYAGSHVSCHLNDKLAPSAALSFLGVGGRSRVAQFRKAIRTSSRRVSRTPRPEVLVVDSIPIDAVSAGNVPEVTVYSQWQVTRFTVRGTTMRPV
jgi:pyruvate-formate lyase-activating enzyme